MNKRQTAATATTAQGNSAGTAPPLPPGPQPTPEQQAVINAAWSQYYASQGISPSTPTATGGAPPPTPSAQYANYGYGAGAGTPVSGLTPHSAGFPIHPHAQGHTHAHAQGGMIHPHPYPPQQPQGQYLVPTPYGQIYPAQVYQNPIYPPGGMVLQPQPQPGWVQGQPANGMNMGMGMGQGVGMGMNMGPGQPGHPGPGQAGPVMHGPGAGGFRNQGGRNNQRQGGGGGGGQFQPGPPNPTAMHGMNVNTNGLGAPGGSGIAQPMASPLPPLSSSSSSTGGAGFRSNPHHPHMGGQGQGQGQGRGIPVNPNNRRPGGLPPNPSSVGPASQAGGPPAKRPRMDGPVYSPTPSSRSVVGSGTGGPGGRGEYIASGSIRREGYDDRPPRSAHGAGYRGREDRSDERRERFDHATSRTGRDYFGQSERGYTASGSRGGRGGGGAGAGAGAGGPPGGGSTRGSGRRDHDLPGDRFGSSGGRGTRGGLGGRGGRGGSLPLGMGVGQGGRFPHTVPKGPSGRGTSVRGRGTGSLRVPPTGGSGRGGSSAMGATGTGRAFGTTGGKGQVMDGEKEKAAKEEARRRTLTDFRIVGLEIKGLGWSWGTVRGDLEEDEAVDETGETGETVDTGETGETGEVDESTGKEEIKLENEEEVQVKKETNESEGSNQTSIPTDPQTRTQDPIKPELEPSLTESKPLDEESSTEEKQEQSSATDTTVQVAGAGAGAGVIETKRGEKRKAKQSSPDADDDALITSKKRATHGPILRTEPAASSSPEKNRFRIYFASPVEDADGLSLKAVHALQTVGEEGPERGEDEEELEEEDGVEQGLEEGEDEGQDEYYEAEGFEGDHDQEGEGDEHREEQQGQTDEQEEEEYVNAQPEIETADRVDEGEMSGVVEDEPERPAEEAFPTTEVETQAEENQVDVAMQESPKRDTEEEPTAEKAEESETAVPTEETSVDKDTKQAPEEPPVETKTTPEDPVVEEKSETVPTPSEPLPVKTSHAPREPSSFRLSNARFRRSPSLPATSSDTPRPSNNRLSILYANGKRRICLNAGVVESVEVERKKGKIRVMLDLGAVKRKWEEEKELDGIAKRMRETDVADDKAPESSEKASGQEEEKKVEEKTVEKEKEKESEVKPKEEWSFTQGILVEALDETHNVFGPLATETLSQIYTALDPESGVPESPPFHRLLDSEQSVPTAQPESVEGETESTPDKKDTKLEMTVYLDLARPLTEPKWVKSGHVDDWVRPGPGSGSKGGLGEEEGSWKMKLKVVDPDAPPTLGSVLENWTMVSKIGSLKERRRFANGHLTSLNNMVQILLRSVRGPSEPLSRSTIAHSHGPLRNAISPKDYYYTKQSYTSLAVMAIVNLVKDYAYEMKETRSVLEERIGNVIKGMPNAVIFEATDSLFLDWTTQEPRAGVGAGGNGRA